MQVSYYLPPSRSLFAYINLRLMVYFSSLFLAPTRWAVKKKSGRQSRVYLAKVEQRLHLVGRSGTVLMLSFHILVKSSWARCPSTFPKFYWTSVETFARNPTKVIKAMEAKSYEGRLRELICLIYCLIYWWWGDMITILQSLRDCHWVEGIGLSSKAPEGKARCLLRRQLRSKEEFPDSENN